MSKLSLREIAQSQLDSTPVIDGQLIVCLDTGNAYRDTAMAHVKIGSDLEVVSDLPLAPLAEKLYYLKPDKLYVFLGGNWTLLNDKTIDLDKAIAKLPAGSSTSLNDDVEIIAQDTDITQPHYYRRKLVVLWEYIKTKAQDFFAAKNHKHGKADITDFPTSMPASDVYPWAKAATKPSYTKAEVGLGKVDNTADADKTVKRATTAGTADSANSVTWENVKNKPTAFPVEAHTHDDRYYTEAEIDGKLSGKSNTDHTHDDRYYTESEIDSKLSGKANSNHTHYSITTIADNRNTNTTPNDYNDTLIFQGLKFNDKINSPSSDTYSYLLGLRGWRCDSSGGNSHELAFNNTGVYWRNGGTTSWNGWNRIYTDNYHPMADVANSVDWSKVQNKPSSYPPASHTHAYLPLSGGTMSGALNFANNTWNPVGDDVQIGDHNTSGSFYIQGLNGPTNIKLKKYGDASKGSGDSATITYNGGDLIINKTIQANLNGKATTAGSANSLSGLSSRSSQGWGVQTGTFVHGEGDSTGGDFAFRRDCPNAGQISMVLDGRFYQNEGQYRVLDESDKNQFATAGHTHNSVKDIGDNSNTTFAYSKAGMNYGDYTWLAGWNGYEMRAVNKNQFAITGHTHTKDQVGLGNVDNTADANKSVKYATSAGNASTATKALSADKATSASSADKAAKLTTARTVSGGSDITLDFKYDGSGNSTANIGFYSCKHSVGNTNNYPFHRFAKLDANKGAWVDNSMTFLISQDYSGGGYGICRLVYRSNADSSNASVVAEWLVRKGLSVDTVQVTIKTDKTNGAYCDAFYKSSGTYMGVAIRAIASGYRSTLGRTWTLVNSYEVDGTTATDKKTSSECWKTIADAGNELHKQAYSSSAPAIDEGYVASAGTADNATTSNGVKDYNDANRTINIGFAGAGLSTSNLTHIAGYTDNGTKIKDVSKDVLTNWIGLGNYLPLSGGTMSGQIKRDVGCSWINDRDSAIVYGTSSGTGSGYHPVVGQKTPSGAWTIGTYGDERLIFDYTKDTDKKAGTNNGTQVYLPAQAGTIITSATIGSQSVNRAEYLANDSAYMRMHWSGQDGQPTWLWGGNDENNMYVWNPSNFSVKYANSAGSATIAWNGVETSGSNYIRFKCGVQICWKANVAIDAYGSTYTFQAAFSAIPAITAIGCQDLDDVFFIRNITKTNFIGDKKGYLNGNVSWIAVGVWK